MKKLTFTIFLVFLGHFMFGQNIGQLKAGYVYQFTNYIEWPASYKSGNFVISILGNSDIKAYLQDLAQSKKVQNQTIEVNQYNSLSQIGKSHIIFVSESHSGKLSNALSHIGGNNTLLIIEKNGGAKQGADFAFFVSGGKLQFNLNKSAIKSHGLKLDPRLEGLATSIY